MLSNRNVALLLALAATAALAACGGSNTASTTAPTTVTDSVTRTATEQAAAVTTGAQITTGSATCSKTEITDAVTAYGKAQKQPAVLVPTAGSYKCSNGWAVAFVNVGSGSTAVTTTVVWQAEGQFWVPQDRSKVCPKPSKVPAAIYNAACNTN